MDRFRSLTSPCIAALLSTLATLAPYSAQGQTDSWMQYGYDSGLSCFNRHETVLSAATP